MVIGWCVVLCLCRLFINVQIYLYLKASEKKGDGWEGSGNLEVKQTNKLQDMKVYVKTRVQWIELEFSCGLSNAACARSSNITFNFAGLESRLYDEFVSWCPYIW